MIALRSCVDGLPKHGVRLLPSWSFQSVQGFFLSHCIKKPREFVDCIVIAWPPLVNIKIHPNPTKLDLLVGYMVNECFLIF